MKNKKIKCDGCGRKTDVMELAPFKGYQKVCSNCILKLGNFGRCLII